MRIEKQNSSFSQTENKKFLSSKTSRLVINLSTIKKKLYFKLLLLLDVDNVQFSAYLNTWKIIWYRKIASSCSNLPNANVLNGGGNFSLTNTRSKTKDGNQIILEAKDEDVTCEVKLQTC